MKQIRDDDDDTVITEITQEFSADEFGCNLMDDEDDKYDNDIYIVIIPTQVLFRISEKLNLKGKSKRKQKWQKEKYSRKVKMKKKIASMIMNATKEYPIGEEDVSKDNEIKGILKTIDRRRLTEN